MLLEWAARRGYMVDGSPEMYRNICRKAHQSPVTLRSDFPVVSDLPQGMEVKDRGEVDVLISWREDLEASAVVRVIPQVVRLGIGCRRGISEAMIHDVVEQTLREHHIDPRAVGEVASIDLNADEEGLLAFCRSQGWPIHFYSAAELQKAEGSFTPSAFVRNITGVDNVCERSALLGAERLLVRKTARKGVTVAAAVERLEISFEETGIPGGH